MQFWKTTLRADNLNRNSVSYKHPVYSVVNSFCFLVESIYEDCKQTVVSYQRVLDRNEYSLKIQSHLKINCTFRKWCERLNENNLWFCFFSGYYRQKIILSRILFLFTLHCKIIFRFFIVLIFSHASVWIVIDFLFVTTVRWRVS